MFVWEPGPSFLEGHVGAPKTAQSMLVQITFLAASVEMLLIYK
jgi:hypothetical protein